MKPAMSLSTSSPSIHIVPQSQLLVQGRAIRSTKPYGRPHTTGGANYQEDSDQEIESMSLNSGATYRVEGKNERQTRIRLESLGRRLRANEAARRETEAELEGWKRRAEKAEDRLPTLESDLKELKLTEADYRMKGDELTAHMKILQEKATEDGERCAEKARSLDALCETVCSLLIEDQTELDEFEKNPGNVVQLVRMHLRGSSNVSEERKGMQERIKKTEEQLRLAQDHVAKLLAEVDSLRHIDREKMGIEKQELEISTDTAKTLQSSILKMEEHASQNTLEMDVLKAELRCARSKCRELEQSERNNMILIRSVEAERNAFLETLSTLLGVEALSNEADLKRKLREKLQELEESRTARLRAEENAKMAEGTLIEHARQHRNAMFRARTSEDELAIVREKLSCMEHELSTFELENKEISRKADSYHEAINKLASILEIGSVSLLDDVTNRVEELVECEKAYVGLVALGSNESSDLLRQLRKSQRIPGLTQKGIEEEKGKARIAHAPAINAKRVMERLERGILSHVTLETIRAVDSEKHIMKKKMADQEKKIRELEKERKDTERLKTIVMKWDQNASRQVNRLCNKRSSQLDLTKDKPASKEDENK